MDTIPAGVVIIGAGSAGMSAYRAAREHTDDVWLIEGGPYGTTCARVGCMPSKLLIAAAEACAHIEAAAGFGIRTQPAVVDGMAVMARVRSERDRFVGFVVDAVEAWPSERRVRGTARFIAPGQLALDDGRVLAAERIVIATGSEPVVPDGWRETLGDRLLISDDVFDWQTLPASIAIVGAGIIGLELGQALHRLGVRVKIFDRSGRPGGLSDPKVIAHARKLLHAELPMLLGATIDAVSRHAEGARVNFTHDGKKQHEDFDFVLAAVGRKPRVAALDLKASGLPLDDKGLPQADPNTGRIDGSAVFLAGDVSAQHMLLHEAADDGRIAGDNAGRFPDVRAQPRRAGLAIAFSDPQIASAGQNHAALLKAGVSFVAGELDFADQGRSRVMRRNRGLLRVYGEIGSGRFLGAEMIGPDAEHLAHLLAWSVHGGFTVQQMLDAPYYHPVIEEGLRSALRELNRALAMGPPPVERCLDCGPGA